MLIQSDGPSWHINHHVVESVSRDDCGNSETIDGIFEADDCCHGGRLKSQPGLDIIVTRVPLSEELSNRSIWKGNCLLKERTRAVEIGRQAREKEIRVFG